MTSFRGTYSCKLDAKGRITFPAQYRRFMTEEDRGSFVIQSGEYDRVLQLYTDETFKKMEEERLSGVGFTEEGVEVRRNFYLSVENLQLDSNDRLLIPRGKLEEIAARGELTLLGMGPYIEIWPSDEFARRYGKRSTAKEMDSAPEVSKAKGAK